MLNKLNLSAVGKDINAHFETICEANPEFRLELSVKGELIVMSPTGGETGKKNMNLAGQVWLWNNQKNLGSVFDSSTCFRLPNGALRSPDVSWILAQRWDSLTPSQQKKFPPIAPDFVLELMSESDRLGEIQGKMVEYMEAGVKLGWLINPQNQQVEIYRVGQPKDVIDNPISLSGEDVLPDFVLDLGKVFT